MSVINIDDYRGTAAQGEAPSMMDEIWAGLEAGMKETGGGAMIIVPAWRESFYGPVEEVLLPDGDKLVIALSHPIPAGSALLITPKGTGGEGPDIEVRFCSPEDEGDGRLSVTMPAAPEPPAYRWVAPGPDRPQ